MHHTDYSQNLRKAQRKTLKNLSPNQYAARHQVGENQQVRHIAIAVSMLIVVLLQMDPANASAKANAHSLPVSPVGAMFPL